MLPKAATIEKVMRRMWWAMFMITTRQIITSFLRVFNDYLMTGLVARFPTLIACGFATLAAIISFFAGEVNKQGVMRYNIVVKRAS